MCVQFNSDQDLALIKKNKDLGNAENELYSVFVL